jgi:glutaconate CoA-transferase subunit B
MDYNANELMVCQAARQLQDGDVVFVVAGLPDIACNLARRMHAPNLVMIYESGVVGASPKQLLASAGDPSLVTNPLGICSMFEIFNYYLQGGCIDAGFLQGTQIDRFGNLNNTVVGDYHKPVERLTGSGGACEVATLAKKVFIIAPQNKHSFPEHVDFITSPGFVDGSDARKQLGMPGEGPVMVITNFGCYTFRNGEMVLVSLHPGCTLEEVQKNIGWKIKVASDLKTTDEPNERELQIIREELDPKHLFI